jgi:Phosphoserine phosphatase RsbU, N-terminal domain
MAHREFAADYADALQRYVRRPEEDGLYAGYRLGRRALDDQISLLDLLTIHHQALAPICAGDELPVAEGLALAARFISQTLAPFEMVQRGADEAVMAVAQENRHSELVRSLSALLADASLAHDDGSSLAEMLALVAEQARELCDAESCSIMLDGTPPLVALDSDSPAEPPSDQAMEQRLAQLTTLAGQPVGLMSIQRRAPAFDSREQRLLDQVAQMLAAALERHRAYPR